MVKLAKKGIKTLQKETKLCLLTIIEFRITVYNIACNRFDIFRIKRSRKYILDSIFEFFKNRNKRNRFSFSPFWPRIPYVFSLGPF